MLSPYSQDPEFTFEIKGKKIETVQNPILGKRNCIFEILKSKDNIYGIQNDQALLQAELTITDLSNAKIFQKLLNDEKADNIIKILNYIYLQNNFYVLILCLYHKLPLVRKTAYTLLCNGFELNALSFSFFKSAFNLTDPYQVLVFPENFKPDCLTFLNREVVRWLTSLYQQTSTNKIWQRYTAQEINLAIEAQKKSIVNIDDSFTPINKKQLKNNFAIDLISSWLKTLPENPTEIMENEIKSDKSNNLKNKWMGTNSHLKMAHKFLERLFEKWNESKDAEFNKAFLKFLSEMTLFERHLFFIYGASSEHESVSSLSFKYITEISTFSMDQIKNKQKESQHFVNSIIQSKIYGDEKNNLPLNKAINEHFNDLINQLKEIENIFIPIQNEIDIRNYVPLIDPELKAQVKKLNYPHQKGYFKSFHFEPLTHTKRFAQMLKSEPNSALEIQSVSGIAIVLGENKTRITALPLLLPDYEFKYKIAFKPSNRFDNKHFKVNKNKVTTKKEKTLEDIFGNSSDSENENEEISLEQILNNKKK